MFKVDIINGPNRQTIHSPNGGSNKLASAVIKKGLNESQSFTFTATPNNPSWNDIKPLYTVVEVTDMQKRRLIFKGRVLDLTNAMTTDQVLVKNYVAESELGYLRDSYQPFEEVRNMSPADFFKKIINNHNRQVGPDKQFIVGKVDVTNSTDSVYRYLQYQTTFQTLTEKLVSRLGGYLFVRNESGNRYIDYLKNSGVESQMPIALARNMLTVSDTDKISGMITRLVPLGATQTDGDNANSAAQRKLTIGSVNGGIDYLVDSNLEKVLGTVIYGTEEWPDVTQGSNLLTKGKNWLASQKLTNSTTVSALDLSLINDRYERYEIGNIYTIKHQVLGVETKHQLTEQTLNLLSPSSSDLTFGDANLNLVDYQHVLKTQQQANSQLSSVLTTHREIINNLREEIITNSTLNKEQIDKLQKQIDDLEQQSRYLDGKIINVSEFQGNIDWVKAKSDGVVLAIIHVQYGNDREDLTYKQNIIAIQKSGIRYAVYAYGLYTTETQAQSEAKSFFNRVSTAVGTGTKPIFYAIDIEDDTLKTVDTRTNTTAWVAQMVSFGVSQTNLIAYITNDLYEFNVDVSKFGSIWIPSDGNILSHPYDLDKYSSTGQVDGITGDVDMNKSPSQRFKDNYLKK